LSAESHSFKAVTFDLWETLLFESYGANAMRSATRSRNVAKTLNKLGINTSLDQATSALNETVNELLKIWDRNKDITHLDQLQYVVKFASNGKVKLKKEWISELSSAYISSLFEIPPYLNPDALEVLQWLKNENIRIGIICNTGMMPGFGLRRFLSQIGIAEFFDQMTFSDEVGIRKPDPKIFHQTARELKTKPCETIHIGDNLKTDIWGAKNAEYKAIHLSSKEGHDRQAENDPKSLVSRSRNLGNLSTAPIAPDKAVSSLVMAIRAIKELETRPA